MSGLFPHLTPTKLVQKISAGEIAIPLVRIESSQKSAKGVHLADLAEYLDARAEAARKEMIALTSAIPIRAVVTEPIETTATMKARRRDVVAATSAKKSRLRPDRGPTSPI
jgi:Pyocin activator protein PrtN